MSRRNFGWIVIKEWTAGHIGGIATAIVASVWLIHGLVNKLLHFSPGTC